MKRARHQGLKEGHQEGREEGIEKNRAQTVRNLIVKLGLSDEQIVDATEVPIDFVKKIRTSLNRKKRTN